MKRGFLTMVLLAAFGGSAFYGWSAFSRWEPPESPEQKRLAALGITGKPVKEMYIPSMKKGKLTAPMSEALGRARVEFANRELADSKQDLIQLEPKKSNPAVTLYEDGSLSVSEDYIVKGEKGPETIRGTVVMSRVREELKVDSIYACTVAGEPVDTVQQKGK